jgi:hypothetical protein
VERTCEIWPLEDFLEENKEALKTLKLINVKIYIDANISKKTVKFLKQSTNRKRLRRILIHILQNQINNELYRNEGFNKKTQCVTAMKFRPDGTNKTRIYCKEFDPGNDTDPKRIVLAHLLGNKDFSKNNKKIKDKIESIAEYEYTFE